MCIKDRPTLVTRIKTIPLEYGALPGSATLAATAKNQNSYRGRWAGRMLKLQTSGNLPKTYPYPMQCWRVGNLTWLTMGGEVVIDFSIKFKKQHGARLWVTSYCNDVMAYIPSLRVWNEGGYEGGGAMLYYGLPSRWDSTVEQQVITEALRQAATLRQPAQQK